MCIAILFHFHVVWSVTKKSIFSGNDGEDVILWNKTILEDKDKKQKEVDDLNDSRIMSVSCLQYDDTIICFCSCSDGNVKCVQVPINVKTEFKSIPVTTKLEGVNHTVMQVRAFLTEPKNEKNIDVRVIGVTSNGKILIWRWHNGCEPVVKPVFSKDLRRSALMCFDIVCKSKNVISIVIGGDDCSVSLWTFSEFKNGVFSIQNEWSQDQVQRSGVVNVKMCGDLVLSCSNDQIIACWDILDGKLVWNIYAGVSDCQGFVPQIERKMALCFGNGIVAVSLPSVNV